MVTRRRGAAARLASALLSALPLLLLAPSARAQSAARSESGQAVLIDRVIGRFTVLEGGRNDRSRPIFARELSLQARLEAMASGGEPTALLTERHIRAALARHVTETLLAELPLDPPATPEAIGEQSVRARQLLIARVGSAERLTEALDHERFSSDELDSLLRRTARASVYLNRMVAPLLTPTDSELMDLFQSGQTPFPSDARFLDVLPDLRRLVLAQRVAKALEDFYQRARSRVTITWAAQ